MKQEIINKITREIAKIKNIDAIYLFGSSARREQNKNSDIDLCIIGKLNKEEKTNLFSFASEKIDICLFNEIPIFIQIRVFSEGKLLFIKKGAKTSIDSLKWNTLIKFREFLPFLKIRIKEMFENA